MASWSLHYTKITRMPTSPFKKVNLEFRNESIYSMAWNQMSRQKSSLPRSDLGEDKVGTWPGSSTNWGPSQSSAVSPLVKVDITYWMWIIIKIVNNNSIRKQRKVYIHWNYCHFFFFYWRKTATNGMKALFGQKWTLRVPNQKYKN